MYRNICMWYLNMKFFYKVCKHFTNWLWLKNGFTTALPFVSNVLSSVFFTSYTWSLSDKAEKLEPHAKDWGQKVTQGEAINSSVSQSCWERTAPNAAHNMPTIESSMLFWRSSQQAIFQILLLQHRGRRNLMFPKSEPRASAASQVLFQSFIPVQKNILI